METQVLVLEYLMSPIMLFLLRLKIGEATKLLFPLLLSQAKYCSFFVMTNAIITYNQKQGLCPEDPSVPGVICNPNSTDVCVKGMHDMLGNGVQTGKCVQSDQNETIYVCQIRAWCPVEKDITPSPPLLDESENFTVLIKNSVHFPLYKVRRRNILETQNKSFLSSCEYDPHDAEKKLCPIFRLGKIAEYAGEDFSDISTNGAVMSVSIDWDCDFDYSVEKCIPHYSFSRLDSPDAKVAPGFNFRYSNNWMDENGTERRTFYKAYGVLFVVQVQGRGGKFDPIPLATNLGSGIALLAIASVVCDVFLLYFLKMKEFYRKKKYLYVTGDDAFDVSH